MSIFSAVAKFEEKAHQAVCTDTALRCRTLRFLWKQRLDNAKYNPTLNACQHMNTGQSPLFLSYSQSKSVLWT